MTKRINPELRVCLRIAKEYREGVAELQRGRQTPRKLENARIMRGVISLMHDRATKCLDTLV